MTPRRPRFRFIPTLGVGATAEDAQRVLGAGLGLPLLDEDEAHLAFGRGNLSLYVDTTGASSGLPGFTPLLATDDLDLAVAHLEEAGCTTHPMPWAEEAPGVLVRGPGGLRFCVVPLDEVVQLRAQRFLDAGSQEGPPIEQSDPFSVAPPRTDEEPDVHRRPTLPGGPRIADEPSED